MRLAGAAWVANRGANIDPGRIAVTAGAQQAILVALAAIAETGDRVLSEEYTYPGFHAVARLLGLKVESLPMDAEGLIPEALERALRVKNYKALYTMPTLHNPTTATLTVERRRAIAALCRRHGTAIVEDDIFGHLSESPPPLQCLAPEITYYLVSLSKTLAPGLRTGYLAFPEGASGRVAAAMQTTSIMAAPLMAALSARLIASGQALALLARRRAEIHRRAKAFARELGAHGLVLPDGSIFAWLPLPSNWRAVNFEEAARQEGIRATAAGRFCDAREARTAAVRLCIGPPESPSELSGAAKVLARLLVSPPLSTNQSFV